MQIELSYKNKTLSPASPVIGDQQELLVDQLHSPLYHTTREGRVFSQTCTPVGLAIPIYSATALAGGMPIWNPAGSGVKVVLLDYCAAYVSGTSVAAAFGLMARNGVGSVIATGSQITAFAETVPVNGRMGVVNAIAGTGGGEGSKVKSSNAGTVTVTAGVAAEFVQTMFGESALIATTAMNPYAISFDFKGRIHVYPGTMVWVAGSAASGALLAQTISWEEIDIATSA